MRPYDLSVRLRMMDVSIEDVIEAARLMAEADRDGYAKSEEPDPLVLACIEACVKHLADANLAMYASYK